MHTQIWPLLSLGRRIHYSNELQDLPSFLSVCGSLFPHLSDLCRDTLESWRFRWAQCDCTSGPDSWLCSVFPVFGGRNGLSAILLATANLTTIDNAVGKKKAWRLAVKLNEDIMAEDKAITSAFSGTVTFTTQTHTFAIVETAAGANPYDVGVWGNWKQVMGNRWWEWALPSPKLRHDMQSRMAEMTPAVAAALEEAGLCDMNAAMRERWKKMQIRQKGFLQLLAAAGAPLKTFATWRQARKEPL